MFSFYSHYWRIGFASRLYDLLTPQAYLDSLARCVDVVDNSERAVWFDAGCGSGLALRFLQDRLKTGARYFGADLLMPGLRRTASQALGLQNTILGLCCDLTRALPMKDASVDVVLSHFFTYTLGYEERRIALQNFRSILKPGGILTLANPSVHYNADSIIRSSLEAIRARRKKPDYLLGKWLLYPCAFCFGLRFIERQLKSGIWKAYREVELCDEIRNAGFEIIRSETVYAGSGLFVVGRKVR